MMLHNGRGPGAFVSRVWLDIAEVIHSTTASRCITFARGPCSGPDAKPSVRRPAAVDVSRAVARSHVWFNELKGSAR
jgi:hypothetical protein